MKSPHLLFNPYLQQDMKKLPEFAKAFADFFHENPKSMEIVLQSYKTTYFSDVEKEIDAGYRFELNYYIVRSAHTLTALMLLAQFVSLFFRKGPLDLVQNRTDLNVFQKTSFEIFLFVALFVTHGFVIPNISIDLQRKKQAVDLFKEEAKQYKERSFSLKKA